QGIARDVPSEAYRRFKADVRARHAAGRQQCLTDLARFDEKTRFLADWVAVHGTPDQRARHAAGVLPIAEVLDILAKGAFAPLNGRALYARDGVAQLQAYLRQFPGYDDLTVRPSDLAIFSHNAQHATATQWNAVQAFKAVAPDADVHLRSHKLVHKRLP